MLTLPHCEGFTLAECSKYAQGQFSHKHHRASQLSNIDLHAVSASLPSILALDAFMHCKYLHLTMICTTYDCTYSKNVK